MSIFQSNVVLQLFAMMLNPTGCLKPATARKDDKTKESLSGTAARAAFRASQLLHTFLQTNGPWRLLCNLPRVSQIEGLPDRRNSVLDVDARKEDLSEFTRGELEARKLDRYTDVWEIVAPNPAADHGDGASTAPDGPVSETGQHILDLLLSAWEWEAEAERVQGASSSRPPWHWPTDRLYRPQTGLELFAQPDEKATNGATYRLSDDARDHLPPLQAWGGRSSDLAG